MTGTDEFGHELDAQGYERAPGAAGNRAARGPQPAGRPQQQPQPSSQQSSQQDAPWMAGGIGVGYAEAVFGQGPGGAVPPGHDAPTAEFFPLYDGGAPEDYQVPPAPHAASDATAPQPFPAPPQPAPPAPAVPAQAPVSAAPQYADELGYPEQQQDFDPLAGSASWSAAPAQPRAASPIQGRGDQQGKGPAVPAQPMPGPAPLPERGAARAAARPAAPAAPQPQAHSQSQQAAQVPLRPQAPQQQHAQPEPPSADVYQTPAPRRPQPQSVQQQPAQQQPAQQQSAQPQSAQPQSGRQQSAPAESAPQPRSTPAQQPSQSASMPQPVPQPSAAAQSPLRPAPPTVRQESMAPPRRRVAPQPAGSGGPSQSAGPSPIDELSSERLRSVAPSVPAPRVPESSSQDLPVLPPRPAPAPAAPHPQVQQPQPQQPQFEEASQDPDELVVPWQSLVQPEGYGAAPVAPRGTRRRAEQSADEPVPEPILAAQPVLLDPEPGEDDEQFAPAPPAAADVPEQGEPEPEYDESDYEPVSEETLSGSGSHARPPQQAQPIAQQQPQQGIVPQALPQQPVAPQAQPQQPIAPQPVAQAQPQQSAAPQPQQPIAPRPQPQPQSAQPRRVARPAQPQPVAQQQAQPQNSPAQPAAAQPQAPQQPVESLSLPQPQPPSAAPSAPATAMAQVAPAAQPAAAHPASTQPASAQPTSAQPASAQTAVPAQPAARRASAASPAKARRAEQPARQQDSAAAQVTPARSAAAPGRPAAAQAPAAQAPAAQSAARGGRAPAYADDALEAVYRVIRDRRDIRNDFLPDELPTDVLTRILEAAHTAPSVGFSQPWDFLVLRDEERRQAVHDLALRQRRAYAASLPKARAKAFAALKIEAILDTPVNIVVTCDPTRGGRHTLGRYTQPMMAPFSTCLAVENLWLAARAEGLGVGWVSFFDERELAETLGLPAHLQIVAYLCIGYVKRFPNEPELAGSGWARRRPLSWAVHEDDYGRRALPGGDPVSLLDATIDAVRGLDEDAVAAARARQGRMTKPPGSLGMLETVAEQLAGLSGECPPPMPEPAALAVFAADHGVHAQGVTPWPQEVTAQMVSNFLAGGAVVNAFAKQVGAEVCVVDVGVAANLGEASGLVPRKIRMGTADMTQGPAMAREEATAAIEAGIETARDLVAAGNRCLLTGDMGIANTTASAALIAAFTGASPAQVTGYGTGIDEQTYAHKVEIVRRALQLHRPDPQDPVGVLAAFGGLEHAALAGFILGASALRVPVVLDGVIAGAAALVAQAITPEVTAACVAGHRSAEPGHALALEALGINPLIDLELRLGEGSGAVLALPLVASAVRALREVATFDSAGVADASDAAVGPAERGRE